VLIRDPETACAPMLPGQYEKPERMRWLDALKATGIVMVVAVHVATRIDMSEVNGDLIKYLVGTIAVPLFFVADGYVFSWKFANASQFAYASFIKKSSMRLLVPWAAFTVLYTLLRVMLEWLRLTRETVLLGNDLVGFMQVIYLSGISPHMYFLLSLFMIRLGMGGCSKVLRWPYWVWIGITIGYIGLYHLGQPKDWFLPGADPILLAFWGLQFYFLGIVFQKTLGRLTFYAVPLFLVCVVATISLRLLFPDSLVFVSQIFYLLAACLMLLWVTDKTRWSFSLGKDTMGIYLLHAPYVVWGVTMMVAAMFSPSPLIALVYSTGVSVVVSWVGARWMSQCVAGRLLLGQTTADQKST
jgi:fucose 4-O-acetylase-like acetyltransferase